MERKKRAAWEECGDGEVQMMNGEECDDGNQAVTDECVGRSHGRRRTRSNTRRLADELSADELSSAHDPALFHCRL